MYPIYTCLHIYIYTYHIYMHAHMHRYMHTSRIYIHPIHTYMHPFYTYIHTYIHTYILYIHACMHIYTRIYIHASYINMHTYILFIHACLHIHTYIHPIHTSSSSSCRAGSTDIPDPLSPLFPIVHRLRQVPGQHPISSHSCWMYVRAGRPTFARPCVGIHKSTSLMSSSLLLQKCPACLVRLTWIVFVIGGRWPYSWCLVGCCRQDLFKIARSILV